MAERHPFGNWTFSILRLTCRGNRQAGTLSVTIQKRFPGQNQAPYICYDAAMKRTTIFLPADLHDQLRRDAFRAKVSMAELIRSRLRSAAAGPQALRHRKDPILMVAGICSGPVLSSGIDESLYGI